MSQKKHFTQESLRDLFESRIVKSKAVGLDGTRLEGFADRLTAETALISRKVDTLDYRFTNYREKLISKGAKRFPRQISVPTVRDRLTLRGVCNCLAELAPEAYGTPPHSHIKAIASLIKDSTEPLSFLRVDIRDFFPSIDQQRLMSVLKRLGCEDFLMHLISGAIRTATGPRIIGMSNEVGVPQGLSISNILSSIFMKEFDDQQAPRGFYRRYVDDIIIIDRSDLIARRYKEVFAALSSFGLQAHPLGSSGKTEEKRISEGVDYLGYNLSSKMISVRDSSYQRMFSNLNKVFTTFKYKRKMEQAVFKLNLRITGCIVDGKRKGWLLFFSQTEDLSQLGFLDAFVVRQCWRYGINTKKHEIARFIKCYHEIRYKGLESGYIPNFDSFELQRKYELIATLTGTSIAELNTRSVETTDREFKQLVAREVADLEQDVLGTFS